MTVIPTALLSLLLKVADATLTLTLTLIPTVTVTVTLTPHVTLTLTLTLTLTVTLVTPNTLVTTSFFSWGPTGGGDRLVVVWDFDDTLVPWYRMKRSVVGSGQRLYENWYSAENEIQKKDLSGSDYAWEKAVSLDDLPGHLQNMARRVCQADRASLLPRLSSDLNQWELETEQVYLPLYMSPPL